LELLFPQSPTKEIPPEKVTIDFLHDKAKEEKSIWNITWINRSKRKRDEDVPSDDGGQPPRKLRTKAHVDYCFLDNPFPNEEQNEEQNINEALISYCIQTEMPLGSRDLFTLAEARKSPDWPEWKKAISVELEQLQQMDTWKLGSCLKDAVPIANKWVFLTKYNKQGELIKYKAQMVAKGCAQRPGYDYTDTFSLVVCLKTIQAILPLFIKDQLKIQQMDVKGAYLNGILQENVFMWQPEGYDDGSERVCQLIKTLYGLKQSGHKWNKKLDNELKEKGL
jgi:Reverse transcriptase (RNA-dependent DNA polymerase)